MTISSSDILKSIKYYLHDFWEEYGDNRISHLPGLNSGPWHVLTITILYIYFVKIVGPEIMKTRKPYNLRKVIIIHNLVLVIINGFGAIFGLIGSNYGKRTLQCEPFNARSKDFNDQLLFYLCYIYYITKFMDFLDTIYFVLRKKFSHITFLHLFHHSVMPFFTYIFFKFSTYTNTGFVALINASVHSIMYTYYAIAAYTSPELATDNNEKIHLNKLRMKIIWMKKYITQIQLVQFIVVSLHSLYFLLDFNCKSSKFLILLQLFHGIFFFYLFFSFYKRTYMKKTEKPKSE